MVNLIRGSLRPGIADHEATLGAHIASDLIRTIPQLTHSLQDPLLRLLGDLGLFVQYFGDRLVTNTGTRSNLL